MDADFLLIEALAELGIKSGPVQTADVASNAPDILVRGPGDTVSLVQVKHRALVTEDVARRLLETGTPPDATLLVVADRVTATARQALTTNGIGYLDLRGRLALRTAHLIIDALVTPMRTPGERATGLGGRAGLEVAVAILMQPRRSLAVRELARTLKRSPSTVSEILAAFRREGLTDEVNDVTGTSLFWRVAERWPSKRTLLADQPRPGEASISNALRLGLDSPESQVGWALTDSAAAAAYGAPVAFRTTQSLDFFVPDQSVLRRAVTLLGTAASTREARAAVRVAPTTAVVAERIDLSNSSTEWPLAHPLFVALDLAQDAGRGREILQAWTPDERWARVW